MLQRTVALETVGCNALQRSVTLPTTPCNTAAAVQQYANRSTVDTCPRSAQRTVESPNQTAAQNGPSAGAALDLVAPPARNGVRCSAACVLQRGAAGCSAARQVATRSLGAGPDLPQLLERGGRPDEVDAGQVRVRLHSEPKAGTARKLTRLSLTAAKGQPIRQICMRRQCRGATALKAQHIRWRIERA